MPILSFVTFEVTVASTNTLFLILLVYYSDRSSMGALYYPSMP